MLKKIEKSKKHYSYFPYVGIERSIEKKNPECLETLWSQNQPKNKELISKKRKTIYQNRTDTITHQEDSRLLGFKTISRMKMYWIGKKSEFRISPKNGSLNQSIVLLQLRL